MAYAGRQREDYGCTTAGGNADYTKARGRAVERVVSSAAIPGTLAFGGGGDEVEFRALGGDAGGDRSRGRGG